MSNGSTWCVSHADESRGGACVLLLLGTLCMAAAGAGAAEIYVDASAGSDSNPGTQASPLLTAQRAVQAAQPGDTIHLGPAGAVIRQEIVLTGKQGITIEGHNCTLTGADPLPQDNWEQVGPNLARRRMPQPPMQRHMLIVGGHANRMGRSPTVRTPFPPPDQLRPGQFCWQDIEEPATAGTANSEKLLIDTRAVNDRSLPRIPAETAGIRGSHSRSTIIGNAGLDKAKPAKIVPKEGWLYVCGPRGGLEWCVRVAGVRTTGRDRDITIRNLNCRHALNDGFNIHGDCRGLRCFEITGYENFDEGFSAHDTCECWVDGGRFWGNDNAVADVNQADTFYRRCEFRDSVSVEVLFNGGKHSLDDCQVIATGRSAFHASATTVGKDKKQRVPVECRVSRCQFRSVGNPPRDFTMRDADVTLCDCRLDRVKWDASNSRVTAERCTLDGQPLCVPNRGPRCQ